ncbi:MAG: hypothetical protein IKU95_03470, partial [Clostridia bacterium]|nr:hypothetical protein [Clostridia bacterium]
VNRQQMATFFMRYFEKFGVDYHTGVEVTTTPADLHLVADYAKASVVMMWQAGLLNGDGVSFNPASNATRAETATLCMRTDKSVDTWYKEPGVPSERIAIDPKDIKVRVNSLETVYFFNDRMECFDEITTWTGTGLSHLPPVEKSSRPGKVLVGYYLDPAFKEPFYAENPVTTDLMVYAKYQDMDDQTRLNLTTFTQMDQPADLTFEIERVSGTTSAANAAELIVKDGSLPVDIQVRANSKGTYTVSPVGEYNKGSTYELTLAEGWNFVGKADTIRTASFSIHMDEVNNLRMGDNILYVEDTTGALSEEIASVLERGADANATGSFTLPASAPTGIKAGDILCVYVGVHPLDRAELANDDDPDNDKALMDPANYIKVKSITSDKVTSIAGRKVTFGALEAEDQIHLYEIPDLFPFYVDSLPTSGGSVNIRDFDLSFYETAYGKVEGTLTKARTKVSDGDFVAFYTSLEDGEDSEVFYGRVTGYNEDTGVITYAASSEEELLNCMDLYSVIDYGGEVLISDAQAADLEARLLEQVEESGFAEEAAYMVADLITKTDNFNENKKLRTLLLTDEEGNSLTPEDIQLMNVGGSFELSDDIQLTVELIRSGKQLHFGNGVQLAIGLDAAFEIEAEDGKVAIDLSATFVQEVELKPAVRADLTYIQGLPIPIPNGVQVNADIDIKSYTGLSFAAEIFTVAEEDNGLWGQMQEMINDPTAITSFPGLPAELVKGVETVADLLDKVTEMENVLEQSRRDMYHVTLEEAEAEIDAVWNVLEQNGVSRSTWESVGDALGKTSITSDLMGFMDIGTETGLSVEYYDTLEQLLTKYSEMVTKETDWIELVRENIATPQANIAGLCIGVSVDFVVRADMSIALGTNLEYQIGKRYSFWFRIGLYTPTADSSTTDLIDEKFAFQFYVMGKLGVKAGIDATFFVGVGSKDVASVGISAELGPYVKLWGFFIYDYSKYRPKGTETWKSKEQMAGALFMEFGLYFMLSFEAEALGLFEYSHDFLDEEIPLLEAGQNRYYYDMNYKPDKDEVVVIRD